VPFYDEHGIRLSRMLTDRGTEFCGSDSHEYELYLAVEDIDHTRTKTKSPQTNGICERFHRTVLSKPPANRRWNGLFAWDEGCGGKHARKIEAHGGRRGTVGVA
jgi:transposase InsO family protein